MRRQRDIFVMYPMEDYQKMADLAVHGRFEGHPQMAYIDVKIRKLRDNPEEEKELEVSISILDTRTSGCFRS